jgi:DNA-directed RNA polymerase subunit RPC12/RpoP
MDFCSKCKKSIRKERNQGYIFTADIRNGLGTHKYDLCMDCWKELMKWISPPKKIFITPSGNIVEQVYP